MNYAVVDTGSNTIRMSIYKYESNCLCELFTEAVFANLAGHIKDNVLTDEGIDVCSEAIIYHKKKAEEFFLGFFRLPEGNTRFFFCVQDQIFSLTFALLPTRSRR